MYVFDLDGTIALNEHRQHFVQKAPKDWTSFHKHCIHDTPNEALVTVMAALREAGHKIAILSGRNAEVYMETMEWLENHDITCDYFRMRSIGDHRDDTVLKLEMMKDLEDEYPKEVIHAVFDDRKKVVDMWRANGYVCFQVAPGEF